MLSNLYFLITIGCVFILYTSTCPSLHCSAQVHCIRTLAQPIYIYQKIDVRIDPLTIIHVYSVTDCSDLTQRVHWGSI